MSGAPVPAHELKCDHMTTTIYVNTSLDLSACQADDPPGLPEDGKHETPGRVAWTGGGGLAASARAGDRADPGNKSPPTESVKLCTYVPTNTFRPDSKKRTGGVSNKSSMFVTKPKLWNSVACRPPRRANSWRTSWKRSRRRDSARCADCKRNTKPYATRTGRSSTRNRDESLAPATDCAWRNAAPRFQIVSETHSPVVDRKCFASAR